MPGFNEAILRQQVATGRINANTILRGPTTNQFWMNAADTPGVSRLMGTCHTCHEAVQPTDTVCAFCNADMSLPEDVDSLGLRYTTEEERAAAQQEIVEGRAKPVSKPAPAPEPAQPSASPSSTETTPQQAQPIEPAPEPAEEYESAEYEDANDSENELVSELVEDVWQTGSAPTRRRQKRSGSDPLVIGMGVMLLCVIALGGFILLTSGTRSEDPTDEEEVVEAPPERDSTAVAQASVPALLAYERLEPEEVPEAFAERYAEIKRLAERAEADKEAERFNEAYDAYNELAELVVPLEIEIEQWRANEVAKAETSELRDRVAEQRDKAQAAEGERWAGEEWRQAQTAWDNADNKFKEAKFVEAGDLFLQAESLYADAESKALAGQSASKAQGLLAETMKASGSEETLRKHANEQIDAMLRLRTEANGQFNRQEYAEAERTYASALGKLKEATQLVELARYRKFYAFEAGFQASAVLLGAARGDGVEATAHTALVKLFERLRITPNPASRVKTGGDVDIAAAAGPLVNDARDAIVKQYGEPVQACYLIGFHASIIDQTLKTAALTDDQQKRIHQSLRTIEEQAVKAGWDLKQLGPIVEQVRITNRKAKLRQAPEETRSVWKQMLGPMQSRATAPRLMDPVSSPGDDNDPELFPTSGP